MAKFDNVLKNHFFSDVKIDDQITYKLGTLRSRSPEQTIEKIMRHLKELNVSRISDITHLDNIGLPTFTACVPDKLTESWCGGKGLTRSSALASVLMEAYEYRAAKNISRHFMPGLTTRMASKGRKILAPEKSGHPLAKAKYRPTEKFDWIATVEINSGDEVLIPSDLISTHIRSKNDVTGLRDTLSSVGMASGNCIYEAILHGIFERIEWDSFMLANFIRARPVQLVGIPKSLLPLIEKIKRAGIEVFIFDITTEIGIPAYQVYLGQEVGLEAFHIHRGLGCHILPEIALSRALTEACQVRLTYFVGAREDVSSGTSSKNEYELLVSEYKHEQIAFRKPEKIATHYFSDVLSIVRKILKANGFESIYVTDLSLSKYDFVTVGVYIPGLECFEGEDAQSKYSLGFRAQKAFDASGGKIYRF